MIRIKGGDFVVLFVSIYSVSLYFIQNVFRNVFRKTNGRGKRFNDRKLLYGNAYGISLLQIYIRSTCHPSPRYDKNIKILASQEHIVSRKETSIFELFSSYFSAILFHFCCRYDDIMERKHGVERRQ